MKVRAASLLLFVFLTLLSYSQTITGRVFERRVNKYMSGVMIFVMDAQSKKQVASTLTDLSGNFKTNLKPGNYNVKATMPGSCDSTIYNVRVTGNSNTEVKFVLPSFCIYDSLEKNKVCPICHKKDQVIPIEYGLRMNITGAKNDGEGVTFYDGGCEVTCCDPHLYCKRDKKKF
jgi:hypothetical protein